MNVSTSLLSGPCDLDLSFLPSRILPKSHVLEKFELNFDPNSSSQGALSHCYKARILARDEKEKLNVHNLFVKVLKNNPRLGTGHLEKLFQREIMFYKDVFPRLLRFARSLKSDFQLKHLQIPKFYYGEVDDGKGCIVLEDLSAKNFTLSDPNLMLLDLNHMQVAVMALAEFHGLCLAFDLLHESALSKRYALFQRNESLWRQSSMLELLESNRRDAANFLSSIPGEEETAKQFLSRLSDASQVLRGQEGFEDNLKCLMHGDLWHNNLLFRNVKGKLKVALIDWQVSVEGACMSDLSFLFLSSTTRGLREQHLHSLLCLYYETLKNLIIGDLGIRNFELTLNSIVQQYFSTTPQTLFFCTNAEDFKQSEPDEEANLASENNSSTERKLSIACDKEVSIVEEPSFKRPYFNARRARKLRRRNFLDACKETLATTSF